MSRYLPQNYFVQIYDRDEAKPMEVIAHLYYRVFVHVLPLYDIKITNMHGVNARSLDPQLRAWTGCRHARIPSQRVAQGEMDPPLQLKHIIEVLTWLFEDMKIAPDYNPYEANITYLCRLQTVNAQQVVKGYKHTKHRPYDMLMAIFAAAHFMQGTQEERNSLGNYYHQFMYMYLAQSAEFDYVAKDVYQHEPKIATVQSTPRRSRL